MLVIVLISSDLILLAALWMGNKGIFKERYKKEKVTGNELSDRDIKKYKRKLHSPFKFRRVDVAIELGQYNNMQVVNILESALERERSYPVKLYIANALTDIGSSSSIPVLVHSLLDAHRWYREKVNQLIGDYGDAFLAYLPEIYEDQRVEMIELIVDFSESCFTDEIKAYLLQLIERKQDEMNRLEKLYGSPKKHQCSNCLFYIHKKDSEKRSCSYRGDVLEDYWCRKYKVLPVSVYAAAGYARVVKKALAILVQTYPKALNESKYLSSDDPDIKKAALLALAYDDGHNPIERLYTFLDDETLVSTIMKAMAKILNEHPEMIVTLIQLFEDETLKKKQRYLAKVLSGKIEYFLMKLQQPQAELERHIVKQILLLGVTSETIDFLNKNKSIELENEIIAILKEAANESEEVKKEVAFYLEQRQCIKCGITPAQRIEAKKKEKKDKQMLAILAILLLLSVLAAPFAYWLKYRDVILVVPFETQLKTFVIEFNYYLVYYSIAINGIYLLLVFMSYSQVLIQSKRWKVKSKRLLFKPKMLPSVSIIAPAFNEAVTIIESANSLLNLEYPDYELIIVNDGSSDDTLERLIQYFDLKRVDHAYSVSLKTKPINGIYKNKAIPKLTLVDKVNGGKADSLNMGINISSKEYFCGIDADSVLERDALLKLASLTLDQGIETPALGGNIFPINGCLVEKGYLAEKLIPQNTVARFQNIEYIRAFMSGRLGWSSVNSLLIISGAFGLFRKERIIGIGGYMTKSGRYGKDTVGEDMELVVRIRRLMRELNLSYKICYAFNANCWTEVPEDMKSLRKQRFRWHQGLIEILIFHRKMLFNPYYGRTGILTMPYFFIFEMLGPFFEIEGYIMVVIAVLLGILNGQIAMLLFVTSVFLGVLVSISSLIIAEKDSIHFGMKEKTVLLLYAVIENFGPRQLISFWRVVGYLRMFVTNTGWGKLKRKGF